MSAPRHAPRDRGFELIHLDDSLLVANKPAGLLAVPGRGPDKQDCLVARVQAEFPDALTVHRLDMATSGLILFARGAEMQSQLSRMFRERLIGKRYVALVAGKVAPETGEIALPLIADWPNRPRQKVDHDIGKPSLTRYRLLDYDAGSDTGYVELEPVTGRSHQLRVHLASLGHAIVGDTLYGGREAERLMLHACLLGFIHPLAGQPLTLTSNPPFRSASDAILPPDLF
ncbi:MAG: RluA family pseudouridine synthase [Gallionella sp.]|nr:RluA family pseudouridine synthase [Gallionella sp.]MCK9353901.1 RluA family pseudouridine synthase [Gallionella sp.]